MVQALSRAFEIVRLVADSERGLRLYEIADKIGLKRTTVYNLASTLVEEGVLIKLNDSRYQLGAMIDELARKQTQKSMSRHRERILLELHDAYPESSIVYSEVAGSDIVGKLYIHTGADAEIQIPENMQLSPYKTVCGLFYFGFLADDVLQGIKRKYPFEYWGLDTWKDEDELGKAVKKSVEDGYSESPETPEDILKFGVPVFEKGGSLSGVITFSLNKQKAKWEKRKTKIIDDIKTSAEKICKG